MSQRYWLQFFLIQHQTCQLTSLKQVRPAFKYKTCLTRLLSQNPRGSQIYKYSKHAQNTYPKEAFSSGQNSHWPPSSCLSQTTPPLLWSSASTFGPLGLRLKPFRECEQSIHVSRGLDLGGKVLALTSDAKAKTLSSKAKTFIRCPRGQGQASRTTRLVFTF